MEESEVGIIQVGGEPLVKTDNIGLPVPIPSEIVKAKLAVMKDLGGGIKETGMNDFHRYAYASDFDVLSAVTPLMSKHGLALEMTPTPPTGPDEYGNMTVIFHMQWQHESGVVSALFPWYGITCPTPRAPIFDT